MERIGLIDAMQTTPLTKPLPGRLGDAGLSSLFKALIVVMVMATLMGRQARAEIFDEHQVKAVFLYNLTHFIVWPEEKALSDEATFTIGLLGENTLGYDLAEVVRGDTVNGRDIRILHLPSPDLLKANPCRIIFVGSDQMAVWPRIRAWARANAILTVSDGEGFGGRGGMVTLLTEGRRIIIEINAREARSAGFDISAKLLKLSRIVTTVED